METNTTIFEPAQCRAKLPANINDCEYAAEEKIDGCRYMLYLGGDPYNTHDWPNALLSRRKVKATNRFSEKCFNLPHITEIDYGLNGTVLDGEVYCYDFNTTLSVMGSNADNAIKKQYMSGLAKYHVFDILFYKGQDVRHLPLYMRRDLLIEIVEAMDNHWVIPVKQILSRKKAAFKKIIESGGEGLVIKDLTMPYGKGWAKMKKAYDISAVITKFIYGKGKQSDLVTSVELSVFHNRKPISIGKLSGLPLEAKKAITANKRKHRHMVVDLFAQEILKSEATANQPIGNLRHASFHRFRPDVNKYTITVDKLFRDLQLNQNVQRKKSS